jgi:hypothetical protein
MKRICAEAGVPLVASSRESQRGRVPVPEASGYLDHVAGIIVYLRKRERGAHFNRAYVLKSPLTVQRAKEYAYEDEQIIVKVTPRTQMSFDDLLARLRGEYRDALLSRGRRDAFDHLVEAWGEELGVMSQAGLSQLDLLLLTGIVDNRLISEELNTRLASVERRLNQLRAFDSVKNK